MRTLVAGTFTTLDGVMQAPGGPEEDRDGGFEHGGWLVPYFDEKLVEIMTEWAGRAGAFLLGRKTYEIFASSWPNSTDPADEIAMALNSRPKYVASRTLDTVDWNNSHLLRGDVAGEVAKLKAEEGGEIQVHGSGNLLQTLPRNGAQFSPRRRPAEHHRRRPARVRARRQPQVRRSRGRSADPDLRLRGGFQLVSVAESCARGTAAYADPSTEARTSNDLSS